MTFYKHVFWLALLCIPLATLGISTANAQQTQIPVSDLGTREQGRVYPLKLTAVNVDCDTAQNFEFEIDSTPWLRTPGGASVPGLGPGQSKSIPALLDFTYMPPGVYYGHVTARCTSCGWYIFSACVENGQDVILKVKVADPADPTNGANLPEPPNPFAGMKPYVPSTIVLDPPIATSDENLLTVEQKNRVRVARNGVKAAQRNGEKARDDVRAARLKKNDCERELARLKAAMDAANRMAGIAAQDATNAQGAANAAAKELADFEKDKADAALVVKLALEGAQGQTTYLMDVIGADGYNSPRAQRARQSLKEADAKLKAARKAQRDINNSYAARKRAADEAARAAAEAKANARQAQADANAATARYNAKARECNQATAGLKDAKKALDDAEARARHAVGIANYEEGEAKKKADKARKDAKDAKEEARKQAIAAIPEEIDRLKKKKKKCENDLKKRADFLTRMFEAVRDLTGPRKGSVNKRDLNVGDTIKEMVGEYGALAGSVALDMATTAAGVQTFGADTAFAALEAAYGLVGIRQKQFTPGIAGYKQTLLTKQLLKNGNAKTEAEAKKMTAEMEKLIDVKRGNADHLRKEIRDKVVECLKIGQEIAKLQAQQKAAKKGRR